GYACDETEELMPLSISLAHKLSKRLSDVRKENILGYLRPDGKTQVTIEYDENNHPVRVDTIVISTKHHEDIETKQIENDIFEHVNQTIVTQELIEEDKHYVNNPTCRLVICRPQGDAGLTGRKIIVDTNGGYARHGGGAYSGKDATKVDRSAAYAARYVAKNIVAAQLARKCEVQLAYAIGVAEPVSIAIDTFGTSDISEKELVQAVRQIFSLSTAGIIHMLNLKRPLYRDIAAYGHFGRMDLDLPWEQTDKIEDLRKTLFGQV